FADSNQRGAGRLGEIWICENAGVSLGSFFAAAGPESRRELWNEQGAAGVAGSSGRISLDVAANYCDAGRYGAGVGRAAENAGTFVPFDVRPAKYFSGERGRRASFVGDGLFATPVFWARWPRRSRGFAGAAFRRCG